MDLLISSYTGKLVPLLASVERAAELKQAARDLISLDLDHRQTAELEMLISGAYSPLTGYMQRADYESVTTTMRLSDGTFWPVPITFDAPEKIGAALALGQRIALRDPEGFLLALLTVGEVWAADRGKRYIGGAIDGIALPQHHDFTALRLTPEEMRREFARRGWRRVLAYQPERALFSAQHAFIVETAHKHEVNVLLHPVVGEIPADEAEYFAHIHGYQAALTRFPAASTALALLPLPPHGAGLRLGLLKAIVARNYGCTHVIVEGVSEVALQPYHEIVGVHLISLEEASCLASQEMHRRFDLGLEIPAEVSFPEVIAVLRRAYPPRHAQGFCVFLTGLSGAGKSTIAKALMARLLEIGGRQITLLDGDIVRKNLSSELGFSRAHRDLNVRRIGYVASEIVKHRGVAICAPIAPYQATRQDVRRIIEQYGGFFEVHVATPIAVCESRDRKGLYAKARAGLLKEFTGVSDPYEAPPTPELAIDTSDIGIDEAVQRILLKLGYEGYLK